MIKIAICYNDENDLEMMKHFVYEYMNSCHFIHMIGTYATGEELLESNQSYHVVFLDAAMGNGINGITIGKKLWANNRKVKIIYTTNCHQYMEQAFNEVHAFAYLKKPIKEERVISQLVEVLHVVKEEQELEQTVDFDIIEMAGNHRIETIIKEFNVDDIYYFEYVNRRIRIRTKEGDFYFIKQMKDIVYRMREFTFASCHQSFLINLKYVKKMKGYDLYLKNGEKLPVSQKKSAEFREKIHLFIQKSI